MTDTKSSATENGEELKRLIKALNDVFSMKYPSIEGLLKKYGYKWEASLMYKLASEFDLFKSSCYRNHIDTGEKL